ncbi:hypothetical protein HHI36_010514 [Cryptolaemus montrouzieri]|uniref:Uncharacterized protein n=1 Tax=Cryptolaemus montrouzieri TaxID=559131 RepID=A0ABD2MJQ4_9CUCU
MEYKLFMKNHSYQKITNTDLPGLFDKAYLKVAVADEAVKSSEITGIFPMKPNIFGDLNYCSSELDSESTKNLANINIPESTQPIAGRTGTLTNKIIKHETQNSNVNT